MKKKRRGKQQSLCVTRSVTNTACRDTKRKGLSLFLREGNAKKKEDDEKDIRTQHHAKGSYSTSSAAGWGLVALVEGDTGAAAGLAGAGSSAGAGGAGTKNCAYGFGAGWSDSSGAGAAAGMKNEPAAGAAGVAGVAAEAAAAGVGVRAAGAAGVKDGRPAGENAGGAGVNEGR